MIELLDTKAKVQWKPVQSTAINEVSYDQDLRLLLVKFSSGGVYEVASTPDQYKGLLAAQSKGKYYQEIFGKRKSGVRRVDRATNYPPKKKEEPVATPVYLALL